MLMFSSQSQKTTKIATDETTWYTRLTSQNPFYTPTNTDLLIATATAMVVHRVSCSVHVLLLLVCTTVVTAQLQASRFTQKTSGTCKKSTELTTLAQCEAAAQEFGWYSHGNERCYSTKPSGCYKSGSDLIFNKRQNINGPECTTLLWCVCGLFCQPGKYQDQTGQTECKDCSSGKFSIAESFKCESYCPLGTHASGTASCIPCQAGMYNDQNPFNSHQSLLTCKKCMSGFYNDEIGRKTACSKTCSSDQEPTLDQTTCVLIGKQASNWYGERKIGTCSDVGRPIMTEAQCEKAAVALNWGFKLNGCWKFLTIVGFPPTEPWKTVVPPGCLNQHFTVDKYNQPTDAGNLYLNTFTSTSPCSTITPCACQIICQPGTYQDQTGQTSCKKCPYNTFSIAEASSCGTECPTGRYANLETAGCDFCGYGTYNDQVGSFSSCKDCDSGFYNDDEIGKSTPCTKTCPQKLPEFLPTEPTGDKKACVLIGKQANIVVNSESIICQPGKYQDQTGQTTCKDCSSGKFSVAGSSSCDFDANSCPLGTRATTLNILQRSPNSGSHYCNNRCRMFNHLSKYVGQSLYACSITCQPGTYQDDTGQTRCKDCTIGRSQNQSGMSYCKMCSPEQMSEDEFHQMFYDDYFSDGELSWPEFKRINIKLGEPLSDEENEKIIKDLDTNSNNGVTYVAFMRWWRRSCHNKPSINNDDPTTKNQQVGSVPTTPSSNDNNQIEEEEIDNTALFIVFIVIGIIVIVAGLFWIKMLRKKRSRCKWKRKSKYFSFFKKITQYVQLTFSPFSFSLSLFLSFSLSLFLSFSLSLFLSFSLSLSYSSSTDSSSQ